MSMATDMKILKGLFTTLLLASAAQFFAGSHTLNGNTPSFPKLEEQQSAPFQGYSCTPLGPTAPNRIG